MAKQHFLAGVGRALLFKGNDLIGVAKTLTESTFDFSITAEDVRGGQAMVCWAVISMILICKSLWLTLCLICSIWPCLWA